MQSRTKRIVFDSRSSSELAKILYGIRAEVKSVASAIGSDNERTCECV